MEQLNRAILIHLRRMAQEGSTSSQMLREIIARLAAVPPHKIMLIKYMREAFCLSLQQAAPIAGWSPDGLGELNDSRIDELLMPEIEKNRPEWEPLDIASSA
jgi:hypothetical protein